MKQKPSHMKHMAGLASAHGQHSMQRLQRRDSMPAPQPRVIGVQSLASQARGRTLTGRLMLLKNSSMIISKRAFAAQLAGIATATQHASHVLLVCKAARSPHLDWPPDACEELGHDHGQHCGLLQHALGLLEPSNVGPPACPGSGEARVHMVCAGCCEMCCAGGRH